MKALNKICVLVSVIIIEEITRVVCARLVLNNDGPAVIGAKIGFSAQLVDYAEEYKVKYKFDDGIQKLEVDSTSHNVSVITGFPSDQYVEGNYCMNVTAEVPELIIFNKKIAVNQTCFLLRRYLIGEILIYEGNRSNVEDVNEVAIGENFTAVLELHDPYHFLKDTVIDYGWVLDMNIYTTLNNSFIYKYATIGEKLIQSRATATFPDSTSIYGYFSKTVTAEVPVHSVNVSGNPFIQRGDLLMLNVSCNGTPPFEYCSEILEDNVTVSNFTCSQMSVFTTCHMEIKRYLTEGNYHLGIYIGNDVTKFKKLLEVKVYNASIKPTLSTVIIPIVCSLLTLIIIAIGISFYIQQRNRLAVEVANFDFQEESDSYFDERTFFEKIFDSFTCRNCHQSRWSCVDRSESDPLISEDSLPYV